MPRVSKVDTCMFCGNAPCTCNVKEKPAPKPRAPRKSAEPKVATKPLVAPVAAPPAAPKASVSALQDAMRSAATVRSETANVPTMTEEEALLADPEWTAAIQAIGPLMHPVERRRFAKILSATSLTNRIKDWKGRVNGSRNP